MTFNVLPMYSLYSQCTPCTPYTSCTPVLPYSADFTYSRTPCTRSTGVRFFPLAYHNNPLVRLRQSRAANDLLSRLSVRCSNEIRPDDDELLRHSFTDPARDTCTYTILFNECFAQFPIRLQTLDRLSNIWSKWEQHQLTYEQIWRKKHYNAEQEQCFNKIWDAVGEHNRKQYQIAVLFDAAHKDMMEKTRTKEKITTCLKDYCERANDKQNYIDLLMAMQQQMDRAITSEIHVPAQLKQLVPFVERLIPCSYSNAWQQFYHTHAQKQGFIVGRNTKLDNQNDRWDDIDREEDGNLAPNEAPTTDAALVQPGADFTCMDILSQATKILDAFQHELQKVSTEWNTLPIEQLLHLFPDIQSAEADIHILKSLIESDSVPYLLSILSFWKQRLHLQYICHGIKNLMNYLQLSFDENSTVIINTLDDLLTINEQTLGQLCYDGYQRYITTCADKYSPEILNLWSQYYLSRDVIDFLHKRTATEMDNLLGAVNDWDDTLISTRTVIDFATLKTFFDQVYARIKAFQQQQQEVPPTLNHIAVCFENVCQAKEFQNILALFPTCLTSLLAIQRLYLELTNKEQSKRQRIIDLMQKSTIIFEQNPAKKYEFNVRLQPQNLTFADISELRDRARLIEYSDRTQFRRETELDIEQLQQFINFVTVIETILKTLSALFISGHLTKTDASLTGTFSCINEQFNDLETLCTDLQQD